MKISELSRRSGVSITTIKFYIREGLLPSGRHTAPNQATYDDGHVERLRLIKALREQGGLSLATIQEALAAAKQGEERFLVHGIEARESRERNRDTEAEDMLEPGWRRLEDIGTRLGWSIDRNDPELRRVAKAYCAMVKAWPEGLKRPSLADYAGVADRLAEVELPDNWDPFAEPDQSLLHAVLGTFLMEPVILALRRAAHRQRGRKLIEQRRREQGGAKS
jgi:DNA-binding transcriptional MerR regulator